ncbi:hypothetical protein [Altericista sp. CCNU0014]|uniref:hypothetical protein n=1 Tax=Altericista sp. CCNU0014 TaxID=3082949 RepID=UPI00384EA495
MILRDIICSSRHCYLLSPPALLRQRTSTHASLIPSLAWIQVERGASRLQAKIEAKETAKEAAVDVANAPEDEDLQVVLRVQLKKLLAQDEALTNAIAQILQEDGADGTPGTQIVQNVTGDRNQVIGQVTGGQVFGNVESNVTNG